MAREPGFFDVADRLRELSAKGDALELTGSKVTQEQASLILAREISKGDDKLVLRDGKGEPIWNWRH